MLRGWLRTWQQKGRSWQMRRRWGRGWQRGSRQQIGMYAAKQQTADSCFFVFCISRQVLTILLTLLMSVGLPLMPQKVEQQLQQSQSQLEDAQKQLAAAAALAEARLKEKAAADKEWAERLAAKELEAGGKLRDAEAKIKDLEDRGKQQMVERWHMLLAVCSECQSSAAAGALLTAAGCSSTGIKVWFRNLLLPAAFSWQACSCPRRCLRLRVSCRSTT
jgi:hypothetical protein